MAMMQRPRCSICAWRRSHIRDGELDEDYEYCDSSSPHILRGLHADPGPIWRQFIELDVLCPAEMPIRRATSERMFLRIPLRIQRENQAIQFDADYVFENQWKRSYEPVTAYHNTPLNSLVAGTIDFACRQLGQGILRQQRLVYGPGTHGGKSGVSVNTDGCWAFDGAGKVPGWAQLECQCVMTSKLSGGASGRYCVRGPVNETCLKVVLRALWVPADEIPSMAYLT